MYFHGLRSRQAAIREQLGGGQSALEPNFYLYASGLADAQRWPHGAANHLDVGRESRAHSQAGSNSIQPHAATLARLPLGPRPASQSGSRGEQRGAEARRRE